MLLKSLQFCIIHHARRIGDIAAMHEAVTDDIGRLPGEIAQQLIEPCSRIAQMPVAKIAAGSVCAEQAGLD